MKNDNFLLDGIQALEEIETPIFMNNNGFYYLSRSIFENIRTLRAKIFE